MKARYSPTQAYRPRRPPKTVEDRDACALYASVHKRAEPTHEAIEDALVALEKMLHRAGNVDGEGDGCGLLVDIPRKIWAEEVRAGGHASKLALDPRFAIGHVFIPNLVRFNHVPTAAIRIITRCRHVSNEGSKAGCCSALPTHSRR